MSRMLPLHTCAICGKTTPCHNLGDHYECNDCYESPFKKDCTRVEAHCKTGQVSRKGFLKWVKKYRDDRVKV